MVQKSHRALCPVTTSSPLKLSSTAVRPTTRGRTFSAQAELRIVGAAKKHKGQGDPVALLRQDGKLTARHRTVRHGVD